jgi:predicted nucleic acid-binding protein
LRFWDSSAVLPLVFDEKFSVTIADLLREDAEVAVWWGTRAECAVAISRLKRRGGLDERSEESARDVLNVFAETWIEMRPTDDLRLLATLLSKYHPLRTADCFQFAAALRWCEGDVGGSCFVCLDDRLRKAAQDEGFVVLPESLETG